MHGSALPAAGEMAQMMGIGYFANKRIEGREDDAPVPSGAGPPVSERRAAARFPLLAPALQGLGRYAHLMGVEYFADLLVALERLLAAPGLPLRQRLLCLLTAADILK